MPAQMRLWRSVQKWVVLWLLLTVLTLLHSGALVSTLYDLALAKARPAGRTAFSCGPPCKALHHSTASRGDVDVRSSLQSPVAVTDVIRCTFSWVTLHAFLQCNLKGRMA